MGKYVASEVAKLMIQNDVEVKGADILVLGITFKENCPDVTNTKAVDVIHELQDYGANVTVFDPHANVNEVQSEYKLVSTQVLPNKKFDAVVLAVAHKEFYDLNFDEIKKEKSIVYDVKNYLDSRHIDKSL